MSVSRCPWCQLSAVSCQLSVVCESVILLVRIHNQCHRAIIDESHFHHGLELSRFTLYGDLRKGNRPSYSRAAPSTQAKELYEELIEQLRSEGITVEAGKFQAMMKVALINDGPVTFIVDSNKQYY